MGKRFEQMIQMKTIKIKMVAGRLEEEEEDVTL